LAAACSSLDELCTWPTALPICCDSEAVMNQPIAATARVPSSPPQRMIAVVMSALARALSARSFSRSASSWSAAATISRIWSMNSLPLLFCTILRAASKPWLRRRSIVSFSSASLLSISADRPARRRFCCSLSAVRRFTKSSVFRISRSAAS